MFYKSIVSVCPYSHFLCSELLDNVSLHTCSLFFSHSFSVVGNRPSERPRRRWKDNIRIDLEEIDANVGNWVDSAQESPCECDIEPPGSISHGIS